MDIASLTVKAQMLKSLIDDPEILVLPNSWDVGSARIVEEAGLVETYRRLTSRTGAK